MFLFRPIEILDAVFNDFFEGLEGLKQLVAGKTQML